MSLIVMDSQIIKFESIDVRHVADFWQYTQLERGWEAKYFGKCLIISFIMYRVTQLFRNARLKLILEIKAHSDAL
jgi:hypothetical protein